MNYEELTTEELVAYIKAELTKGRTMVDIETTDFNVNDRVIVKRLKRLGYVRVGNEFVFNEVAATRTTKTIEQTTEEQTEETTKPTKPIKQTKSTKVTSTKKAASQNELTTEQRLNKLEQMFKEHMKETKHDTGEIILKGKVVNQATTRQFRVDTEVLEKWDLFVADHKEFKITQLISLAIEEFINKYK